MEFSIPYYHNTGFVYLNCCRAVVCTLKKKTTHQRDNIRGCKLVPAVHSRHSWGMFRTLLRRTFYHEITVTWPNIIIFINVAIFDHWDIDTDLRNSTNSSFSVDTSRFISRHFFTPITVWRWFKMKKYLIDGLNSKVWKIKIKTLKKRVW